ncbi:MAG: hypothetical protein R3213_06750, partial [Flavobacteriaceae bacterium]|nr:hypothetical protein [Flavobacteriaceae bacterium]
MNSKQFKFYDSNFYKFILCISTGGFFYFFIIFFLPFGIDNYNPKHQYTLAFLSEMAYFVIFIWVFHLMNEFLLRPIFNFKPTARNILVWSIWTLILLSSITFLTYNFLGGWHDFKLKSYSEFLINVSTVLIFPLIGAFFFFKHQALQQQIESILT